MKRLRKLLTVIARLVDVLKALVDLFDPEAP